MCRREAGSVAHVNLDWCLRSRPAPAAPKEPAEDGRGAGAAAAGEEEERSDGDVKWRETNPPQPALHTSTCDREEEVRQQTVVTRVPALLQAHHAAQGGDDGDGYVAGRPVQGIPGEREGVPS